MDSGDHETLMFNHKSHDLSKSKNCSQRKPGTSHRKPGKKKSYHKNSSSSFSRNVHNKSSPARNKKNKKVSRPDSSRKTESRGYSHSRAKSGKKKAHRGGTRCDMRRAHFSAGRMNAIKKCIRQTEDLDMDIEELGGGAWRCSFTGRNGRKVERVVDCPSHGHTCSERGDRDGAKTLYFSICEMLDNCYYE